MADILDINKLKITLREFAKNRDWEKFHNPKNLAMSVACESGELLEVFQWMSDSESSKFPYNHALKERIEHEISDVILYLVRLSDLIDININDSIIKKIEINNKKYPPEKVKGNVKLYNKNHS